MTNGDGATGADAFATGAAIARRHGERTLRALEEIARLADLGARLAGRGDAWFSGDPDHVPGLACESLIIKIGENVARIDESFRRTHPDVPWAAIKDMRNRLTHYYEATDHQVVWDTVCHDLPVIGDRMAALLGR